MARLLLSASLLASTLASPLPDGTWNQHGQPPQYSQPSWNHPSRNSSTCSQSTSANPGPGVEHHEVGHNGSYWPYQIFKSSPFNPPEWQINATGDPLAPGLIFTTPSDTFLPVVKDPAPQITTDKGQLVWFGPTSNATNFKWQMLNGEPTLTFWSGLSTSGANIGHGYGNITMMDPTYKVKTILCPNFGLNTAGAGPYKCEADIHESYLTDRNTILISAYNATPADLTTMGGPADGWVWDSQFYEMEPLSGKILFRWSSFEHVGINGSQNAVGDTGNSTSPWDYFHINSVVNMGDHYLMNSRFFSTVYYLDKNGNIEWRFSGTDGGDFGPLPAGGAFRGEHYVRPHNVTNTTFDVSFFNNNNNAQTDHNPTSLAVYRLPLQKSTGMTAQLLSNLTVTNPMLYDASQGSYLPDLPDGHQFANYGQLPILKEFTSTSSGSKEIWSGRVGPDNLVQVYRGYKQIWHATPYYPPSLVVEPAQNQTMGAGYVSWNGATDVTGWNVYVGKEKGEMQLVGQTGYRGFETKFDVACWAEFAQVGAVVNGTEVRMSEIVAVGGGRGGWDGHNGW